MGKAYAEALGQSFITTMLPLILAALVCICIFVILLQNPRVVKFLLKRTFLGYTTIEIISLLGLLGLIFSMYWQ